MRAMRFPLCNRCGGVARPNVLMFGDTSWLSERLGRRRGVTVVRINPREPWIDEPHLSIPEGSLAALRAVDTILGSS